MSTLRYVGWFIVIFIILGFGVAPCLASPRGTTGRVDPISTQELKVNKITLEDGKKGWEISIPGNFQIATPCVVDGTVYIGGGFGSYDFYAFDAKTGKPKWAVRCNDDGPTAAVVVDRYVVFNTESCTLFILDAKTGKQIWSIWLGDPLMSQPAVANGRIYMAYPAPDGHHLICLDLKTGEQYWDTNIAGDIIQAPVISGDAVYLTTFDGTVYCYATDDGELRWSQQYHGTSAPWVDRGKIYLSQRRADEARQKVYEGISVLDHKGKLERERLDEQEAPHVDQRVQTETSFQEANQGDSAKVGFSIAPETAKAEIAAENVGQSTVSGLWGYQGSRPIVYGRYAYASRGQTLQKMDVTTETVIWEQPLEGNIQEVGGHLASPPAVTKHYLVVGTTMGEIAIYSTEDGRKIWSYKTPHPIRFQPALADGFIYVGTTDGKLICIDYGDPELTGWNMWGGSPAHNGPVGFDID
jgi:Ca-activated chloride channel family protein